MLLLLRAAVAHQHRGHHLDAEGQLHRRVRQCAFDLEDVLLGLAPAGATEVDRPVRRAPAVGVQDLLPALDVLLHLAVVAAAHAVPEVVGERVSQETANLIAEREFLLVEIKIHEWLPPPQAGVVIG